MKIIKFILLLVIILFLILILNQKKDYGIHPKIIWAYWDRPDKIPKAVKLCIESWKKHNPEYKIILLTSKNYNEYLQIPTNISSHKNFNDSPARFSDLLRLYALAEHGGVWIDSSILLKEPLDNWLFNRPAEFSGFYLELFTKPDIAPVIESWFLACNKDSKFMILWRDEFLKIMEYPTVDKYVESRKEMGVDYEKIDAPSYLAIHIAAQKILQIDKYPQDRLILRKAEDGPYKYLVKTDWNSENAVNYACKNKENQGPIMKMRSHERNALESKIDNELSPEICGWLD